MSWFTDTLKSVAPFVPIAIAIFAPEEFLADIGTSLGATAGTATATAVGSAAVSGGATALAGGSPEDVAKSAGGAFIGSEVSQTAAPYTNKAVATGLGQTTSALATGKDPETALKQGLIAGSVEGAFGSPSSDASAIEKATTGAEKYITSKTLSDILLKPSTPTYQTGGGGGTTLDTSVTTTGAGQSPGSQALGQALRVGDVGGAIFGSGDKESNGKKSGWNVESLRYMGNSEA